MSNVVDHVGVIFRWPPPLEYPILPHEFKRTYAGQLDTAVTALGGGSTLLDVKDTELTTGGLDDPRPVGGGVVSARPTVSRRPSGIDDFLEMEAAGQEATHGLRRR